MSGSITINSNIASLNAQRRFSSGTKALTDTFTRLSSGLRINKASDDAAGLAVSESLRTDQRVFNQGIRNLNDGISAIAIAEGAMTELNSIVERITELAAQSMNGTLGSAQRGSMQNEVTALEAEWNRIRGSTSFNGLRLLAGETTRMVLQGGYGEKAQLAVEFGSATEDNLPVDAAGTTVMASVASDGTQGNGNSNAASISTDGRFVAFASAADNLVAGDTNGAGDIFVRDIMLGTITRVSVASDGAQANNSSSAPSISANGRFVAFASSANNLVAGDTNGLIDIFVRDTVLETTTRVNVASDGTQGNGTSSVASISDDGRFVAFTSSANNLVAGDTNGFNDIFVRDTVLGTTTRVNVASDGTQANFNSSATASSISANGRFVAFTSSADNLVAGDTNGFNDIFVRDTVLETTTRVSVASDGTQGNSISSSASISDDGRYVAFLSAANNLVAGDTNGFDDIFIHTLFSSGGPGGGGITAMEGMVVSDAVSAGITLESTKRYRDDLHRARSALGASASRIGTFVSVLETTSVNYAQAGSQIRDADVAAESASLIRNQILQQAGAAVLAQANQQPAIALRLLQELA